VTDGRLFAYVRVSTQAQTVIEQQHQIERWAADRGSIIADSFIDAGISASIPFRDRPAGSALWNALRPGDAVVAAWLDRMFRRFRDCLTVTEELQARRVGLYLLDTDNGERDAASDKMLTMRLYIGATLAEQESDRLGARIKAKKTNQKARGEYLGGKLPWGWRRGEDGELVETPEGQKAIARIINLHKEGKSLRAIAKTLGADGIVISHVGVQGVIKRMKGLN
jgi:putative DNA-invertase from lambdoid prophage Rac